MHSENNHSECEGTVATCKWEYYETPEEVIESYPQGYFDNLATHESENCPYVEGGCVDQLDSKMNKTHLDELDWDNNFEWATGLTIKQSYADGTSTYSGALVMH